MGVNKKMDAAQMINDSSYGNVLRMIGNRTTVSAGRDY